ncbi:MAG: type II toxin-antitoxin system HicB family antitoxin [Calditrichaeota bacterium]|nr:type II toxin-antitoxin system HicB family antitoxin [Calditrichota bacterium]
MKFHIVVKKVRDDLYLASCPNLKGCHVQATTAAEAKRLIQVAIQALIKSYQQHHEKVDIR